MLIYLYTDKKISIINDFTTDNNHIYINNDNIIYLFFFKDT